MESKIAPGFLVAAPHMKDPYFERSVVLMLEHDDQEGSMGLIVNQLADLQFGDLLPQMGIPAPRPESDATHPPVMVGGPVSPELGWIIHTGDWTSDSTAPLFEGISVTASIDLVREIALGRGPSSYLMCLGYAGWAPGQLIDEMRTGAWLNVPAEQPLIFDVPAPRRWDTAIERLGIDAKNIVPIVGDA